MSVITCKSTLLVPDFMNNADSAYHLDWWGFELVLPPPSIKFLSVSQNNISSGLQLTKCRIERSLHLPYRHEFPHRSSGGQRGRQGTPPFHSLHLAVYRL